MLDQSVKNLHFFLGESIIRYSVFLNLTNISVVIFPLFCNEFYDFVTHCNSPMEELSNWRVQESLL